MKRRDLLDRKDRHPDAYTKALALLARREHSVRELSTKLAARGYADDEALAAIARLQEQGYQSDARFAEALTRARSDQGYGPNRLRAELKNHGIEGGMIEHAIAALDINWQTSARRQLRRRRSARSENIDAAERARRARFLLRRGFDPATVRAITRADIDASGEIE
ncbi:MAG: regulatory protein RecX [Rhodanobacteraceae bacterium]